MRVSLIALMALALVGCQSGPSVTGKWHIEQTGQGFGPGADKIDWDFKDDKSFTVTAGPMTIISGTYQFDGKTLTLSNSNAQIPMNFRFDNNQLIPVVDGKDVTFYKLVRK